MKASVGNKVKVINDNFEGEIKAILPNNRLIITCTDGFDYEFSSNEVVIISDDNKHFYSIDEVLITSKIKEDNNYTNEDFLRKYTTKSKFKYNRTLEIDLHLEKLVDHPEGLDDWQRLHTQMQHVKNCLSAANQKNIKRIVFIHGVGTGVLKTELLNYLSSFEEYTVLKADFNEYGNGATEVLIKN
ncbi:MAG: Smr/MutS family protein [Vicingaceae bacterium]